MADTRTRPVRPGAKGREGDQDDTRRIFEQRRRRGVRSRWRWIVGAVVAVALVAGGVWLVGFSSYLAVHEVEVDGTSSLSAEQVEDVADVPEGRPLARVDLDAIQRRVEGMAAVRDATVSRAWPDGILIEVTERVAIAVVDRDGTYRGVDAEGVAFQGYDAPPEDLPVLTLGDQAGAEAITEGARVVAAMPADTAAQVASITVETVDEITLTLRDGATVVWGSAEDSEAKAEVLEVLVAQSEGVTEYDVSVPARPTTR